MQLIALDDCELPGAGLGDGGRCLGPLVRGISEDTFYEREEAARASIEDERCAVAILYSGPRADDDVQQQAERVDQDMPFAARASANIHLASTAAALGRRDHRLSQRPFSICQIARISQTAPLSGAAMFRFPHLDTPLDDFGAHVGITNDLSDSTTFWIGSKAIDACLSYFNSYWPPSFPAARDQSSIKSQLGLYREPG